MSEVTSSERMKQYQMTPANFRQLICPHIRDDLLTLRNLSISGKFFREAIPAAVFRTFVQPIPATLAEIQPFFNADEHRPTVIKAIIVGHKNSKKFDLVKLYADDNFGAPGIPTIGVDFRIKNLTIGDNVLKMQLWDTAEQKKFGMITAAYLKGAKIIYHVCDMEDRKTLTSLEHWLSQSHALRQNNPDVVGMILIRNKQLCTIEDLMRIEQLALKYGIAAYHGLEDNPGQVEKALNVGLRYHLNHRYNTELAEHVVTLQNNVIEKLQAYLRLRLIAHDKRAKALIQAIRDTTEVRQISTLLDAEIKRFDEPKRRTGREFTLLETGLRNRIKLRRGFHGTLIAARELVYTAIRGPEFGGR